LDGGTTLLGCLAVASDRSITRIGSVAPSALASFQLNSPRPRKLSLGFYEADFVKARGEKSFFF
jgi:hypothetical protein